MIRALTLSLLFDQRARGDKDLQHEQLRYLLALLRIPGLGPVKLNAHLKETSELNTFFDARDNCLIMPGKADWAGVERDLAWAKQSGCYLITKKDSAYPPLLKEIHSAPYVLFIRGNPEYLSKPQIAMVGSRNASRAALETAYEFARHFSSVGFTVTSGLAAGIDGASHKGALLGEASTIAVLGSGLDSIYPAAHRSLGCEIATKGALVSEFPIGTPALASHFPRRNRIISGLAVGTLVIEANLASGSLITAKFALDQGREVFAIPGSIHSPLAKGCHALIRQGAKLVESPEDVLEELGAMLKYISQATVKKEALDALPVPYDGLLEAVGFEVTSIDLMVSRSGLTADKVSSMLLELELQNYVMSVPGGYQRV